MHSQPDCFVVRALSKAAALIVVQIFKSGLNAFTSICLPLLRPPTFLPTISTSPTTIFQILGALQSLGRSCILLFHVLLQQISQKMCLFYLIFSSTMYLGMSITFLCLISSRLWFLFVLMLIHVFLIALVDPLLFYYGLYMYCWISSNTSRNCPILNQ